MMTDLLLEQGIRISMAAVGKPKDSRYAKRLMRTIKEEEVDLSEYKDFQALTSPSRCGVYQSLLPNLSRKQPEPAPI
ncbi:MAG: hypothetical protein HXY40_08815 [Chloroflexi bacterium]|nr:hypothetical protein [Chloroflexota bacterium]